MRSTPPLCHAEGARIERHCLDRPRARAAPAGRRAARPPQRPGGWRRRRGPREWRRDRPGCSDAAPSSAPEELVTEANLERALERDPGAGRRHLCARPADCQRSGVEVTHVVLVEQVVDTEPEDHVFAWPVVEIEID